MGTTPGYTTADMPNPTFKKPAPLDQHLPIRLTLEQRDALRTEAKRLGCTDVDVVRDALTRYFDLPKSARPQRTRRKRKR